MKDGHGGITVGSEISGGVRNLFAENCKLDSPDLWTALRVKNNASRGGKLENFYFRNMTVGVVSRAVIEIDFNYEEGAKGEYIPLVRNYVVENLTSRKSKNAVDLQGLDNAPIYEISLKNCTFEDVSNGNVLKNVKGVKLDNVKINGKIVESLENAALKKSA
jgi:polygalacturonase